MVQLPPPSAPEEISAGVLPAQDRRRPGRPASVSPSLLPLLRRDSLLRAPTAVGGQDDLAPARGVAVSVLIGALLWAGLAMAVYWLLLR